MQSDFPAILVQDDRHKPLSTSSAATASPPTRR